MRLSTFPPGAKSDPVSFDIDPILRDWPYLPDEVTVRMVEGADGRRKIQLRLDLGLLQMEIDGRPDGRRIHELNPGWNIISGVSASMTRRIPTACRTCLEPEDCAELLREGVQYYHRYVCFWHLDCYELCARDTERNLRLFAFVREHARNERDKLRFDQWRPYVTMMHARAVATPLVELEQWDAAAGVVDAGIRGIERFLEEYNQVQRASEVGELTFLRKWKEEIQSKIEEQPATAVEIRREMAAKPADRAAELRAQIELAIAEERFEDAAVLRDELKQLGEANRSHGAKRFMTRRSVISCSLSETLAAKRDRLLELLGEMRQLRGGVFRGRGQCGGGQGGAAGARRCGSSRHRHQRGTGRRRARPGAAIWPS